MPTQPDLFPQPAGPRQIDLEECIAMTMQPRLNRSSAFSPAGDDVYFAFGAGDFADPTHCATFGPGGELRQVVRLGTATPIADHGLTADDVRALHRVLGRDQQDAADTLTRKGLDDDDA